MDTKLNGRKVVDLEVDGVDSSDGPEFVDAFFSAGTYDDNGQDLTDEELDQLTLKYPDVVNQIAFDNVVYWADLAGYAD